MIPIAKKLAFNHLLGNLFDVSGYVIPGKTLHTLPASSPHLMAGLFGGNEMGSGLAEISSCINEKASMAMLHYFGWSANSSDDDWFCSGLRLHGDQPQCLN